VDQFDNYRIDHSVIKDATLPLNRRMSYGSWSAAQPGPSNRPPGGTEGARPQPPGRDLTGG
jgi:hypothetical protein